MVLTRQQRKAAAAGGNVDARKEDLAVAAMEENVSKRSKKRKKRHGKGSDKAPKKKRKHSACHSLNKFAVQVTENATVFLRLLAKCNAHTTIQDFCVPSKDISKAATKVLKQVYDHGSCHLPLHFVFMLCSEATRTLPSGTSS
jgi:hypothetical protein